MQGVQNSVQQINYQQLCFNNTMQELTKAQDRPAKLFENLNPTMKSSFSNDKSGNATDHQVELLNKK